MGCRRKEAEAAKGSAPPLPAKEATSVQAPVVECLHISIHASHEGSDVVTNLNDKDGYKFQSTLPAREATDM